MTPTGKAQRDAPSPVAAARVTGRNTLENMEACPEDDVHNEWTGLAVLYQTGVTQVEAEQETIISDSANETPADATEQRQDLHEATKALLDNSHPFANLFPLMEGDEYAGLVEDIRVNGLREAIWVDRHDRILDGRNRMRACVVAGVPCIKKTFDGDDDAILRFVISKNLHRRHLDTSQRALIAAELASHRHGGDRRADQAATLPLVSQDEAGRLMNVSPRSVRHAVKVKKDGDDELVNAVKSGDVSVAAAAKVAKKAPEVQRKILTGDKRQIQRKVAEITTKRKPLPAAQLSSAQATAHELSVNIRQQSRHVIDGVRFIGEELVQARTKLSGSYPKWLQAELGWSDEDARRFIEVRDRLDNDDADALGVIDLSVLNIAASFVGNQAGEAAGEPEPGSVAAGQ